MAAPPSNVYLLNDAAERLHDTLAWVDWLRELVARDQCVSLAVVGVTDRGDLFVRAVIPREETLQLVTGGKLHAVADQFLDASNEAIDPDDGSAPGS